MDFVENIFLALAYVAVIGFLISGLDDFFFDSYFLVFLFRNRKQPHITLKELKLAPEQWIALMVPAWQEGGVVNKMAEYAARVVLYEKYDIFIGVYPNDPETIRCVDELCAVSPRIHKVVVPHPGPTSKADCLNWIYRGMRLQEIPGVKEYKVIAIHDSEDVIHPLVLKVYNYFVPRVYDMGQVPVFALELPVLRYWTANNYIDDFAELHTKDLFVRQSIGGILPSAGVGTAFARHALDRLAAANNGDPFFIGNLTEDYEVGIRVKRAGYRAGLISVPLDRIVRRKRSDGTLGPPETVTEVVAIRESFPSTFRAAVRQRSRWILGISFQTWEQAGWGGTLPMRYTLVRDRRAPLTHFINMIGYITLVYVLFQWAFRHSPWGANFYLRPVFNPNSLLWKITIIDSWLLVYRGVQKFISVQSIYNVKQAVFSIPRVVVGNFINFVATIRAGKMYLSHKLLNTPIVWLKTSHVFPGEAELSEYTKSIEDLLVEEGLATREQIFQALKVQQGSAPLCLLRLGLLDEKQFTDIWAKHSGLDVRVINPHEIPEAFLRRFPEAQAMTAAALPFEEKERLLQMAFREPPTSLQLAQLSRQMGVSVQPFLARPSNLAYSRNLAYPRLVLPPSGRAGQTERFRQAARVEPKVFLDALSSQQATGQSLPDVLVAKGMLAEAEARRLWAATLELPALDLRDLGLNQELYFKVGPSFWWLHRMLPVTTATVACAAQAHQQMLEWLAGKMGATPVLRVELPNKLDLAARNLGVSIDPDQILLDCLAAKGLLKPADLPSLKSARELIADPLPKWLLLQKKVTEEQLHQTFLEICYLPPATLWTAGEVKRLAPALAPGFAEDAGCYCLEERDGAVRLGLAQMPSLRALREVHERLAGYPIFFQALSYTDTLAIRQLLAPAK